jgi:hypothetical protein
VPDILPKAWKNWKLSPAIVFCLAWAILFALYFPAAQAGFVTDFTGWLDQVAHHGFWEHLNRTNYANKSLYQFTQLLTYLIYKAFGLNRWLWHVLFVTLHALNCALLWKISARLMNDAGVQTAKTIAFIGILFFCVSAYSSEVIVWEPAFHFLLALLCILVILDQVQQFAATGRPRHAWIAAIIFFLSTYSLELFYVTPWLVLGLIIFYKTVSDAGRHNCRKALTWIFIPLAVLFLAHLVEYRLIYGEWVAHIGSNTVVKAMDGGWGKPAKYLFHLLLLGRFLSEDTKRTVYSFLDGGGGITLFYGLVVSTIVYVVWQYKHFPGKGKVMTLFSAWLMITLLLLVPIWFTDLLLVLTDRYLYLPGAIFYLLLSLILSCIGHKYLRGAAIAVFLLANLRFAILVIGYWGKSEKVDFSLLQNFPDAPGKTIILLNVPESMHGIPMIGSGSWGEYKLMHNLLLPSQMLNNTIYDVASYNMLTPADGAHVSVLNDSTVRVTLNQWGTWWWYEGKGGSSYDNRDYKLNMVDVGHMYELTLHCPVADYMLLYEVGPNWKVVDWSKKGQDQN